MAEKKRITRGLAAFAFGLVAAQMPPQSQYPWEFGGSWRRGSELIGDIDVMVTTPSGEFGDFPFPRCFQMESGGGRKVGGTVTAMRGGLQMHADFWACTPAEAGPFMMFVTGPAALNIRQRAAAKERGFTLSQYGLTGPDGELIPCATEEDVYAALGWEFVPPDKREKSEPAFPDGSWEVQSDSGAQIYTVTVKNGYWSCKPCRGFQFHRDCKHIQRQKMKLAAAM